MGDTSCHTAIMGSIARAKTLLMDIASKGVQHIVFFFYPHIANSTGADANAWLDYAYPSAQQVCCGAGAPQGSDLTCHGTPDGVTSGTDCVFVDTRPEFVGHNDPSNNATYWFMDGIHPTQTGANAIASKVWAQMQKYCVAQ
jgi:hypothetical protein